MEAQYILPIEKGETRKLASAWLFLGIFSLLASGIFSILLVLSRTPAISEKIPFLDFFHTALVVHVDLSVLIWFTSFSAVLWTLISRNSNKIDWLAVGLAILGTLIIVITPFIMDGHPLMNNYIPVLQTPLFYAGLGLFTLGLLIRLLRTLQIPSKLALSSPETSLRTGVYLAALTSLLAIMLVVLTLPNLPRTLDSTVFFEILFWGGGHIIQFSHILLVFVVWIILLQASNGKIMASARVIGLLLLVTFLPVLLTPFLYFQADLLSGALRLSFTQLMKYGSLASLPLGIIIVWSLLRSHPARNIDKPLKNALWASLALFAAGGILGFMIEGVNVVIPAHYHGSIVGITLAFMGFSFYLLPLLGYPLSSTALKLAKIQPLIYATGQFMHISGLAWSGGYGVQRKTAGSAQGLENLPEIAGMALMGMGGLIAIIGGILFVVVALMAIFGKTEQQY